MKTKTQSLIVLAAAALMTVMASSSHAGDGACGPAGTWTEFRARVAAMFPGAVTHAITGVAKEQIVARYNSTPPATVFQPDNVRYLTLPNSPRALIVLQKGNCVVATAQIPLGLLRGILKGRGKGIDI